MRFRKLKIKIGTKLVIGFLIVIGLFCSFFYINDTQFQKKSIETSVESEIQQAQASFESTKERDTNMLSATLESVINDPAIKVTYLEKDRDKLYGQNQVLFDKLKNQYGITHWYFILPDGHVFLRMHQRDQYDDLIGRATFQQARDTGKMASGIELGKTAYALRVVTPYYDGGQLIGYVELGEEIGHFLKIIQHNSDNELSIAADKKFLSQPDWAAVRQTAGLRNNWDDWSTHLIIGATEETATIKSCFTEENLINLEKGQTNFSPSLEGGKYFGCGGFEIKDAREQHTGEFMLAVDVSDHVAAAAASNRKTLIYFGSIFGLALLLSLLFVRSFARSIGKLSEGPINIRQGHLDYRVDIKTGDEIEELGQGFNEMAEDIQNSHMDLEGKIQARTQELEKAKKGLEEKVWARTRELEESKATVEEQVRKQTAKLQEQNYHLEDMRKAVVNILEDVAESEQDLRHKTEELQKATVIIDQQKERVEGILRFLKSIGDGVVATDMDGKIIFFNEAAEKLTGVPNEKAIGGFAWETLWYFKENDPENQIQVIRKFLAGEKKFNRASDRLMLKRKDGAVIGVSFSISFIYDTNNSKQGCILVMRDVTEERELEKNKDNFLSVAAHQLRTPLSGIRWSLEMLLGDDVGKLPGEAHEVVENINENTMRLITLVNDLLNVSRINMGKVIEPASPVNVAETISAVLKSGDGFVAKNKIKIVFDANKKAEARVFISPQHFFESIENIVSNAIKYTPEQGTVKITVSSKGNQIKIAVADSGIGIPKKEQEKMFSKFFRAQNAIQKDPDGSGLGLSVVKSFIEEAGGTVSFESEEGKGTTFFVSLPIYSNTNSANTKGNISTTNK